MEALFGFGVSPLGSVRTVWVAHGYGLGSVLALRIADVGRMREVVRCYCDRFGECSFRLGLGLPSTFRP